MALFFMLQVVLQYEMQMGSFWRWGCGDVIWCYRIRSLRFWAGVSREL